MGVAHYNLANLERHITYFLLKVHCKSIAIVTTLLTFNFKKKIYFRHARRLEQQLTAETIIWNPVMYGEANFTFDLNERIFFQLVIP